ncbi:hypothetical protein LE181_08155 [Streptomyces sp. SCA3-4]|uniref:hypothetical protein n=1 Tax=Streptomyces sichuanensis TaxID=2871810 RepID=UPI001CE36C3D|nr:hypothetical protein [Streptomyces sichuanensis]MCA6092132.1 hypothetical protein [Streptomyces sichuanensis]
MNPPDVDWAEPLGGGDQPTVQVWNVSRSFVNLAETIHGGQHVDNHEGGPSGLSASQFAVERREGDIPADSVVLAGRGFAEPAWFPSALAGLDSRLLFLTGRSGSGRRTAALNLLHRHTGGFALRAVDSDVDLATWTATSTTARGYLVDGLVETRVLALDALGLDSLRSRLRDADARMVVITTAAPRVVAHLRGLLDRPPVHAEPPPPRDVLTAQLTSVLLSGERTDAALAGLPPGLLDEFLTPGLGPAQVVEIAGEVVRAVTGEAPAAGIRERLSIHADAHAPHLLRSLHDSPEDLALLLATCVFEQFDHTVVEEEARRLKKLADGRLDSESAPDGQEPEAGRRPNPEFVLRRPLRDRLEAIEACRTRPEVRPASAYNGCTVVPVAFKRHLQGKAVLKHVWEEHHDARGLLVEWLRQTPESNGRGARAGFILGQLARWSSGHQALRPVEQFVDSDRPADWRMAARALGAASADPVLAGAIKSRLRGWSGAAGGSRRCTVALTCATEFGLARPETALNLLHATVTTRADDSIVVESAVRRALVNLFTETMVRLRLLNTLARWAGEGGAARRTACAAVAQMVKAAATIREPGEWWSDHLLADRTPDGNPSADPAGLTLIRRALTEQASYAPMRDALLTWQDRAAGDPHRAPAFEHLVDGLAPHLHGGVFRLFTDLECAVSAPGAERAARALAEWRQGVSQRGRA